MKTIAVVIDTTDADRAAEALRAAVGLGLRGDAVAVVVLRKLDAAEPRAAKALAALRAMNQRVDAPLGVLAEADAVEVWT